MKEPEFNEGAIEVFKEVLKKSFHAFTESQIDYIVGGAKALVQAHGYPFTPSAEETKDLKEELRITKKHLMESKNKYDILKGAYDQLWVAFGNFCKAINESHFNPQE